MRNIDIELINKWFINYLKSDDYFKRLKVKHF